MTPTQLRRIRARLVTFANSIFEPIPRKDQRARGETYLRGLLLDGKRKSIEPMAPRVGRPRPAAPRGPRARRPAAPAQVAAGAGAARRAGRLGSGAALLADAAYGEVAEFRLGLEQRELAYVVQVPGTISAYPQDVAPQTVAYTGRGRPPVPRYRQRRSSLRQLVLAAGAEAASTVAWREGADGAPLVSRFVALRVRPAGVRLRRATGGGELQVRWLLAEWPPGEPEPVAYWLATLPADTPLERLVGLAKLRWRVEHDYRELKDALGLDHFEGRSFKGWHHHVTLVSAAHAFVTLQRLDPKAAASA
jgi:SRSO17 transposase